MVEIKIDLAATPEQIADSRFQRLLLDTRRFFSSPKSRRYKLLLGLHEAGHAYFARKAGATNIRYRGPVVMWDARPQYNCPAISRSATIWTPGSGAPIVEMLKSNLGGFVVRRELSDDPNDHIAIESDLETARQWFDENVGTGDDAFSAAITEAETEILRDLKSEAVVTEIWAEAKRFVHEVFPRSKPAPKDNRRHIKVGRNEPCPCGSGMKYKRCHIDARDQFVQSMPERSS